VRVTTRLRELLASHKTLFVPGCYNALSARIMAHVGFQAIYMSGYQTSLSLLGMPDAGLATMTEMHLNARSMANAVKIPIIADADNGYGNAINVLRAVREYIQTGVAGIHLEDQVLPKRCGHVAGRRVISIEEAVGKYKAANDVRQDLDPDFLLVARTDARGAVGGSIDEAIRRANAYLEAGADIAFVEGPKDEAEIRRVVREVDGPVWYNLAGISPRFSVPQMEEMGIKIAVAPGAAGRATIVAVHDIAKAMFEQGPMAEWEFELEYRKHPLGDYHRFTGFDQVRAWEEAYLPPEEQDKYEGTLGHRPGVAAE
jgi:2-methylisocitrate lyase-like PEP mutase family enzyme